MEKTPSGEPPMGLKEKSKARRRALVKVVLFIVRVQNRQRKRQTQTSEPSHPPDTAPLLRCSTVPALPVLITGPSENVPSNEKGGQSQTKRSQRGSRDSNGSIFTRTSTRQSFLSIWDENESNQQTSGCGSPYTRSRASSSVSRCSYNSKTSESTLQSGPSLDDDDANYSWLRTARFVDFTTMNKPYTLNGFGELTTPASSSKLNAKDIMVTCNSVMGNPKRLGRKLIRRGSTTEIRDENRYGTSIFDAPYGNKLSNAGASTGFRKPPMIRTQTADSDDLRKKCTSDENVAAPSESTVSPIGSRKFVKRKSSADLLLPETISRSPTADFAVASLDRLANFSTGNGQLSKAEKKKLEKLKENMKQLLELFTAVEQDDIGKVRSLLHHTDMNINGENMDELTLLDVAVMLNHTEVALLLLKHGSQENPKLLAFSHRMKHVKSLIDAAQAKLAELALATKQLPPGTAPTFLVAANSSSSSITKGLEKQLSTWESRLHMLKKMRNNMENCPLPNAPKNVTVYVASSTSLVVTFDPPEQHSTVVTKYKIEWSVEKNFSVIDGTLMVRDLRRSQATICNLRTGIPYYVRVCAGNFKGFGEYVHSDPDCALPSSWRDIDQKLSRSSGRVETITDLFHELRKLKKTDIWERIAYSGDAAMKKKKASGATLKNLFASNAKFQKNPKRGVFLATIMYKDDKVLCTVDDCLPVVEIDENVPTTLSPDFQWFMKLSCAWEDMRSLHLEASQVSQSPSLIFRLKLLEAAALMQSALGIQDLGRLHCSPIVDARGVTVLVTVQYVHDVKLVQGLALKWMQISKLFKKQTSALEKDMSAMDLLISGLLNYLNFYESTYIPLDRGLYLGYVKLHSSMNQISIVVPENLPSVLPFVYIRDNPHVSKEEWEWLRMIDTPGYGSEKVKPTPAQLALHWSLVSAARILLNDLEIADDEFVSHRIYRLEVVEIHSDVSFILLVPSHSDVCSAPGQPRLSKDEKRGCLTLPVPMFEVAHLCTYQPDFIALYCRLSVFLEFYTAVLQQLQRQTLNEDESKTYRQLIDVLNGHQQRLEEVWKSARWISSVATAARDRQLRAGLPLSVLFAYNLPTSASFSNNIHRLSPTLLNESHETGGMDDRELIDVSSPTATSVNIDRNGDHHQHHHGQNYDHDQHRHNGCNGRGQPPPTTTAPPPPQPPPHPHQQQRPLRHRRRGSSGERSYSDQAEENSDVGYHSDQSIEPNGLKQAGGGSAANARNQQQLAALLAAENPTYDYPERILASINRPTYVNVDAEQQPSCSRSGNDETLSIANREYFDQQQPAAEPNRIKYRTQIGVDQPAPIVDRQQRAPRRHTHDYINCPASDSNETPRRLSAAPAMTVSDSEQPPESQPLSALNSARSDVAADQPEDLSLIDQLYAEAASVHCEFRTGDSGSRRSSSSRTPTLTHLPATASPRPSSSASSAGSVASVNDRSRVVSRAAPMQSPPSGFLRVYAAYACGLAKGTSVKLHVTPRTTSVEVVTLVVRQLNKACEVKGLNGPIYGDEELCNFVLVAVIGSRERCLRDDFPPLELQNPWSKGKLFVRRKTDLLAALEYGNEVKV